NGPSRPPAASAAPVSTKVRLETVMAGKYTGDSGLVDPTGRFQIPSNPPGAVIMHWIRRTPAVLLSLLPANALLAQVAPGVPTAVISGVKVGGSANVRVLSHIPMGGLEKVADLDIEQELSRPYVYVSQLRELAGFQVVSLKDMSNIRTIYRWRIENIELHRGNLGWGGKIGKYVKLKNRYYYVQSFEFGSGSPDQDLGAIVFDVTGLPDTTTIKEVSRIRA